MQQLWGINHLLMLILPLLVVVLYLGLGQPIMQLPPGLIVLISNRLVLLMFH
ncbi:putative membrane protein [Escherichia coli 6-537-08_S3_C3]|nr:putative membrane protein [Escherichia coli 6-537-08_S3_C3]